MVRAEVAGGAKCERCWRVVPDVGADARWPSVCARCAEALAVVGFPLRASLLQIEGEAK